ncbi:unnamed protein product, partial [Rotaria sordida]
LQQCAYVLMDEADVKRILEYLPVTNQQPDNEVVEDTR